VIIKGRGNKIMEEPQTFITVIVILLLSLFFLDSSGVYYKYINGYVQRGNEQTRLFYMCQDYGSSIHCDRSLNELQGYVIRGNSSKVYQPTAQPMYVNAKLANGLEMHANRFESIEFRNIEAFNSQNFSVSFWVKRLPLSEPIGNIVSHFNNENAGWYFQMLANGNVSNQNVRFAVARFIDNSTGNSTFAPEVPIPVNTFVHIAATFDGSSIKIFKDGNLAGIADFHGKYVPDFKSPLRIGAAAASLGRETWSGIIDDLRLYNRTLSKDEVKNIFITNSTDTVTKGLVGRWKFDNNLNDTSVSRNNGVLRTSIANMAFTPDGRLFFTEKNTGMVRIMKDDKVLEKLFIKMNDTYVNWEQGLLTLAIDPKFKQNHYIYLYYTAGTENDKVVNRLVRFTDKNNTATSMVTLMDNIPASHGYHSGGALGFGPDDKLYIAIGDATYHEQAQNVSALIGKVLRINRDGTIPADNPYLNSSVYTIGHRNIFGIAFDNKTGIGIIAENGDNYYDEINLIQKGGNYGFPTLQPPNIAPELADSNSSIIPLRSYWGIIAPTQTIYYDGDKFPELKGKFIVGTFGGGTFHILKLDKEKDSVHVIEDDVIRFNHYPYEAIQAVAQSPDGDIYFGAANIYKLQSIDNSSKMQMLFPIGLNFSNTVAIKNLDLKRDEQNRTTSIDLDLQTYKLSNQSSYSPVLSLKVPKIVSDQIYNVTITEGNKTKIADSAIETSAAADTMIKIKLPSGAHLQSTVVGRYVR